MFVDLEYVTISIDTRRLPGESDPAYYSRVYEMREVDPTQFTPSPEVLSLVPSRFAVTHRVVPLERGFGSMTVAMADPSNVFALIDLRTMTGLDVEVVVASEEAVAVALARWYGD